MVVSFGAHLEVLIFACCPDCKSIFCEFVFEIGFCLLSFIFRFYRVCPNLSFERADWMGSNLAFCSWFYPSVNNRHQIDYWELFKR